MTSLWVSLQSKIEIADRVKLMVHSGEPKINQRAVVPFIEESLVVTVGCRYQKVLAVELMTIY